MHAAKYPWHARATSNHIASVTSLPCTAGQEIGAEDPPAENTVILDTGYKSLNAESLELYLGLAAQQFRDMLHLGPADNVFLGHQKCLFGADGSWGVHAARSVGDGGTGSCFGGVFVVSPGSDVLALWELDLLVRKRFCQIISETVQSLRSLMQLVRF